MGLNIRAVMNELGAILGSIDGLRAFAYPAPNVTPPAAFVGWPDEIDYDLAMARGAWGAKFPVLVAVGKADVESARDAMSAYLAGDGPLSVRAALDAAEPVSFDAARVTGAQVRPVTIAGIEYLAAILDVEIIGQGE